MPKPDRDPAIVRAIAIAWLALMLMAATYAWYFI
jgi:hypothetical protein